jgi:hypothetical protein
MVLLVWVGLMFLSKWVLLFLHVKAHRIYAGVNQVYSGLQHVPVSCHGVRHSFWAWLQPLLIRLFVSNSDFSCLAWMGTLYF